MCFGCSKEPSHQDGSFEFFQHMFWLRNKKNNFQLHTLKGGLDIIKCMSHCGVVDTPFTFFPGVQS